MEYLFNESIIRPRPALFKAIGTMNSSKCQLLHCQNQGPPQVEMDNIRLITRNYRGKIGLSLCQNQKLNASCWRGAWLQMSVSLLLSCCEKCLYRSHHLILSYCLCLYLSRGKSTIRVSPLELPASFCLIQGLCGTVVA